LLFFRGGGASPSGNIKGTITLESGKTKRRAAVSAAATQQERRERGRAREEEARAKGEEKVERELYALRESASARVDG